MIGYIFDLDNTLYNPNTGVLDAIDKRINLFMEEVLKLEDVNEKRQFYRDKYGTTLLGLMKHYKTKPETYLDFVHDIDYNDLLQEDVKLQNALKLLDGKKVVFTNGSYKHAVNTLEALGIYEFFDNILSIEDYIEYPKPFASSYQKLIDTVEILPQKAVYFEDSQRNLHAAVQFGFKTALVWGENNAFDYSFKTIYDIIELKKAGAYIG